MAVDHCQQRVKQRALQLRHSHMGAGSVARSGGMRGEEARSGINGRDNVLRRQGMRHKGRCGGKAMFTLAMGEICMACANYTSKIKQTGTTGRRY